MGKNISRRLNINGWTTNQNVQINISPLLTKRKKIQYDYYDNSLVSKGRVMTLVNIFNSKKRYMLMFPKEIFIPYAEELYTNIMEEFFVL